MKAEGRGVSGSGNGISKGDVKSDKYLIECKYTDNLGYRLTKDTWRRIELQALKEGRIPLMAIEIKGTGLIVCDEDLFWELAKEKK